MLPYNGTHFLTVVNCQWSTWSAWVSCSATCGGGTHLRTRFVEQNTLNGGTPCTGSSVEDQQCNTNNCQSAGEYPHETGIQNIHIAHTSHLHLKFSQINRSSVVERHPA